MDKPTALTLHQKLIEIRKTCKYLQKDNQGFQFMFVSSSQTLGTLRTKMDELGVLLIPHVINHKVSDHLTDKKKHEYFTELEIEYEWINADNPSEIITCKWYAQGLDNGEKGVGKALTYSEKYYLLKFFNIATDKDDPDAHQRKIETVSEDNTPPPRQESPPPQQESPPLKKATKEQLVKIKTLCGEYGIEQNRILVSLSTLLGRVVSKSTDITENEANSIVKAFHDKTNLEHLGIYPQIRDTFGEFLDEAHGTLIPA